MESITVKNLIYNFIVIFRRQQQAPESYETALKNHVVHASTSSVAQLKILRSLWLFKHVIYILIS